MLCKIRSWFKKKEVKPKLDLEQYKIKLNVKTCCLFEKLSGKSWYECNSEQDAIMLMYCSLVTNNDDMQITFKTFSGLMQEKEIAVWISEAYLSITEYMTQIVAMSTKDADAKEEKENKDKTPFSVQSFASYLIIEYGMDCHYVMYEMDMWEFNMYLEMCERSYKDKMAEQRLWTYLTVMPHIDSKKCKSPDKLLPFPWEKEEKNKKAMLDITENKEAILNVFKKKIKNNGEGRIDSNT